MVKEKPINLQTFHIGEPETSYTKAEYDIV